MRINIIGFSSKGCALAKRMTKELSEHDCSYYGKTIGDEHGAVHVDSLDDWTRESFETCDALVFVGAAGIAVRHIAPYLRDKTRDPAVIVLDELGINVIPILSGHIGGANKLAETIGERTGANVIITTATDLNNVFSVDTFAVENDMYLGHLPLAKLVSARLLEGKPVHIKSDTAVEGTVPRGLTFADSGDVGIYISPFTHPGPFGKTLRLIPRQMTIGIGCRRDIKMEAVERRVIDVLKRNNISIHSLKAGASIDLKSDEKGLLEFFKKYDIPVTFLSGEELKGINGEFTDSDYVESITGVGNVCERSAVAISDGGEIVVKKDAADGVTVAIASERPVIRFGGNP